MTFKYLLLGIFCFASTQTWHTINIGDNLTIKFPQKPKNEKIIDVLVYSTDTKYCDFSVMIDEVDYFFPKNENENIALLQNEVGFSKKRGVFISSKMFNLGQTKGIEIKSFFTPNKSVKLIQVIRTFYYKGNKYELRCLYKPSNELACVKDCDTFFHSLRFKK